MDARWQELMPRIMAAYLQWKYRTTPSREPTPPAQENATPTEEEVPDAQAQTGSPDYDLDLDCLDFYTLKSTLHVPRTSSHSPAEALVLHGFLGATPDNPSIAVSLETLELFRHIRRFKASYSVEAFTKLLCYRYYVCKINTPMNPYLTARSRSPTVDGIERQYPTRLTST